MLKDLANNIIHLITDGTMICKCKVKVI